MISYVRRKRWLETEKRASVKRLSNISYAKLLYSMGYHVPDIYLRQTDEKASDSIDIDEIIETVNRSHSSEQQTGEFNKKILVFILIMILAATGVFVWNNQQNNYKQWQTDFVAASLFDSSGNEGSKFVVHEAEKKPYNSERTYKKKYLPKDLIAQTPEEVGYIVEVLYRYVEIGQYSGGLLNKPAYRVDTIIQLYDRHAAEYIGREIVLQGGEPPQSIRSSKCSERERRRLKAQLLMRSIN